MNLILKRHSQYERILRILLRGIINVGISQDNPVELVEVHQELS